MQKQFFVSQSVSSHTPLNKVTTQEELLACMLSGGLSSQYPYISDDKASTVYSLAIQNQNIQMNEKSDGTDDVYVEVRPSPFSRDFTISRKVSNTNYSSPGIFVSGQPIAGAWVNVQPLCRDFRDLGFIVSDQTFSSSIDLTQTYESCANPITSIEIINTLLPSAGSNVQGEFYVAMTDGSRKDSDITESDILINCTSQYQSLRASQTERIKCSLLGSCELSSVNSPWIIERPETSRLIKTFTVSDNQTNDGGFCLQNNTHNIFLYNNTNPEDTTTNAWLGDMTINVNCYGTNTFQYDSSFVGNSTSRLVYYALFATSTEIMDANGTTSTTRMNVETEFLGASALPTLLFGDTIPATDNYNSGAISSVSAVLQYKAPQTRNRQFLGLYCTNEVVGWNRWDKLFFRFSISFPTIYADSRKRATILLKNQRGNVNFILKRTLRSIINSGSFGALSANLDVSYPKIASEEASRVWSTLFSPTGIVGSMSDNQFAAWCNISKTNYLSVIAPIVQESESRPTLTSMSASGLSWGSALANVAKAVVKVASDKRTQKAVGTSLMLANSSLNGALEVVPVCVFVLELMLLIKKNKQVSCYLSTTPTFFNNISVLFLSVFFDYKMPSNKDIDELCKTVDDCLDKRSKTGKLQALLTYLSNMLKNKAFNIHSNRVIDLDYVDRVNWPIDSNFTLPYVSMFQVIDARIVAKGNLNDFKPLDMQQYFNARSFYDACLLDFQTFHPMLLRITSWSKFQRRLPGTELSQFLVSPDVMNLRKPTFSQLNLAPSLASSKSDPTFFDFSSIHKDQSESVQTTESLEVEPDSPSKNSGDLHSNMSKYLALFGKQGSMTSCGIASSIEPSPFTCLPSNVIVERCPNGNSLTNKMNWCNLDNRHETPYVNMLTRNTYNKLYSNLSRGRPPRHNMTENENAEYTAALIKTDSDIHKIAASGVCWNLPMLEVCYPSSNRFLFDCCLEERLSQNFVYTTSWHGEGTPLAAKFGKVVINYAQSSDLVDMHPFATFNDFNLYLCSGFYCDVVLNPNLGCFHCKTPGCQLGCIIEHIATSWARMSKQDSAYKSLLNAQFCLDVGVGCLVDYSEQYLFCKKHYPLGVMRALTHRSQSTSWESPAHIIRAQIPTGVNLGLDLDCSNLNPVDHSVLTSCFPTSAMVSLGIVPKKLKQDTNYEVFTDTGVKIPFGRPRGRHKCREFATLTWSDEEPDPYWSLPECELSSSGYDQFDLPDDGEDEEWDYEAPAKCEVPTGKQAFLSVPSAPTESDMSLCLDNFQSSALGKFQTTRFEGEEKINVKLETVAGRRAVSNAIASKVVSRLFKLGGTRASNAVYVTEFDQMVAVSLTMTGKPVLFSAQTEDPNSYYHKLTYNTLTIYYSKVFLSDSTGDVSRPTTFHDQLFAIMQLVSGEPYNCSGIAYIQATSQSRADGSLNGPSCGLALLSLFLGLPAGPYLTGAISHNGLLAAVSNCHVKFNCVRLPWASEEAAENCTPVLLFPRENANQYFEQSDTTTEPNTKFNWLVKNMEENIVHCGNCQPYKTSGLVPIANVSEFISFYICGGLDTIVNTPNFQAKMDYYTALYDMSQSLQRDRQNTLTIQNIMGKKGATPEEIVEKLVSLRDSKNSADVAIFNSLYRSSSPSKPAGLDDMTYYNQIKDKNKEENRLFSDNKLEFLLNDGTWHNNKCGLSSEQKVAKYNDRKFEKVLIERTNQPPLEARVYVSRPISCIEPVSSKGLIDQSAILALNMLLPPKAKEVLVSRQPVVPKPGLNVYQFVSSDTEATSYGPNFEQQLLPNADSVPDKKFIFNVLKSISSDPKSTADDRRLSLVASKLLPMMQDHGVLTRDDCAYNLQSALPTSEESKWKKNELNTVSYFLANNPSLEAPTPAQAANLANMQVKSANPTLDSSWLLNPLTSSAKWKSCSNSWKEFIVAIAVGLKHLILKRAPKSLRDDPKKCISSYVSNVTDRMLEHQWPSDLNWMVVGAEIKDKNVLFGLEGSPSVDAPLIFKTVNVRLMESKRKEQPKQPEAKVSIADSKAKLKQPVQIAAPVQKVGSLVGKSESTQQPSDPLDKEAEVSDVLKTWVESSKAPVTQRIKLRKALLPVALKVPYDRLVAGLGRTKTSMDVSVDTALIETFMPPVIGRVASPQEISTIVSSYDGLDLVNSRNPNFFVSYFRSKSCSTKFVTRVMSAIQELVLSDQLEPPLLEADMRDVLDDVSLGISPTITD